MQSCLRFTLSDFFPKGPVVMLLKLVLTTSLLFCLTDSATADDSAWERLPDGSLGQVTEFEGVGGVKIPAYIRKPAGDGPFPTVVMLHGGRYGKDATIGMGRGVRSPMADFLKEDWAIYSIDYRPSDKMLLPIEIDDSVLAVEAVKKLPFVDPRRVALRGGSHGANVSSPLS